MGSGCPQDLGTVFQSSQSLQCALHKRDLLTLYSVVSVRTTTASQAGLGRWCSFYKYPIFWLFCSKSSPSSSPGRFSLEQAEHKLQLQCCATFSLGVLHEMGELQVTAAGLGARAVARLNSEMQMGTVVQGISENRVICRRVFQSDYLGAAGPLEAGAGKQWAALDSSPLYTLAGEIAHKYA